VWALREFKRLHRGVDVNNVAQTYIVPDNSAFPPQLWGYPLGVRLKNLRQKRTYLSGNFSESREKLIRQVSERSERALMKTRIVAMNPVKWLQT
jgi:hypothetical protein